MSETFSKGRGEVTNHGTGISVFLSKLQCQVRHSLSHALHCHCLVVGEPVILKEGIYAG